MSCKKINIGYISKILKISQISDIFDIFENITIFSNPGRNWRKLARPAVNQAANDRNLRGRRRISTLSMTSSSVKRTLLALTVQIARETGIPRSSVTRIVDKDLKLKCLKRKRVQQLTDANRLSRLKHSQVLLDKFLEQNETVHRGFPDELAKWSDVRASGNQEV